MPFVESDGVRLFYAKCGKGEPLMFLHGFGLHHEMWADQIDYFAKRYMTIAPDARGHGRSDSPPSNHARENRVDDILAIIEQLELTRIHLVGLSMGGGDALAFAIDHPDRLYSLTLAGTVAAGWQPVKRYKDYSDSAKNKGVEYVKEKFIKAALSYYDKRNYNVKTRLNEIMHEFDGVYWLDPMKGRYPIRNDLELAAHLKVPTLIVVGQHDIFFRPLAEKLAGLIPDSHLEIIKDSGHMVNMEKPDEFNAVLEEFLNEIG
jgi:pimeloyl-ACP methyl ester carboxylesterase